MSAQNHAKVCAKCWKTITVTWPPTEHKCEQADLSGALPAATIQISIAEYEALRRDAERYRVARHNIAPADLARSLLLECPELIDGETIDARVDALIDATIVTNLIGVPPLSSESSVEGKK